MDEKLKEFLIDGNWIDEDCPCVHCRNREDTAQAVADFERKRVLEEIRGKIFILRADKYYGQYVLAYNQIDSFIDQRLAKLKGEKDGNSPSGRISKD